MENEQRERLRRIEESVRRIEAAADRSLRATALGLVRDLMELHGEGLRRLSGVIAGSEGGAAIMARLAADEWIAGLLLLYGLHPEDLATRARRALERTRPYLRSHGGDVELVSVRDGVATLRLEGACSGCPSSAMTLKLAVEQALYDAAPDLAAIEVEGVSGGAAENGNGAHPGAAREKVTGLDSLADGAARTVRVDGHAVLFCRLGEALYAYGAACAACGAKLESPALQARAIVCPGCGRRYDAIHAGRGLDGAEHRLEPLPTFVEDGAIEIILPKD